jgi:hypothetical protein
MRIRRFWRQILDQPRAELLPQTQESERIMDVCKVTKEVVRGPGPRVQCLHMHMRLVSNSRDCGRARRALESNRVLPSFSSPLTLSRPPQRSCQASGSLGAISRSASAVITSRTALRSSDTPRRALLSQHSTSLAFVSLSRYRSTAALRRHPHRLLLSFFAFE